MTQSAQMAELVTLWALIIVCQLTDAEDTITWRWTKHGLYTRRSAYRAQFVGSYSTFNTRAIWSSKTEGKHRFFRWLWVQKKVLTADKLLARNWPCHPVCLLCDQEMESPGVFALEVWLHLAQWSDGLVHLPTRDASLEDWWNLQMSGTPSKQQQKKATIMIYATWNLWKERNRRVFEGVSETPSRVVQLINDEMSLRATTCCRSEPTVVP
jgi:hypothetical protein